MFDDALQQVTGWPVTTAAAAVVVDGRLAGTIGDVGRPFELASVSKLLTAWATLVAVEEGTVSLDEPAGPPGSTVRHLLAHAAGHSFDSDTIAAPPGRRRIYSNTGYEVLAAHVAERSGIAFEVYVREAVTEPLGMHSTETTGSAAKDFRSSVADLAVFAGELISPTLVSAETAAEARSPQFPELAGLVPGVGRFDPCPWGLGPELRGNKVPHWTAPSNHPETFGHFGGAGTFLWVDPLIDLAVVALTDRRFGPWSLEAWPVFGEAVLAEHLAARS